MASKLVTVFSFALLALLGQAQAQSSSNCEVSVEVTVVDGESTATCTYDCDEAASVWYSGIMYKRSDDLQSELDSMVQIVFTDGQITGCSVVPYLSTEELQAEEAAIQSCLDAAAPQEASLYLCPENFSQLGDSCYLITPNSKTKSTGSNYCSGIGAALATVDSQEEQDTLGAVVTEKLYTSLTRLSDDDDDSDNDAWITASGAEATYFNWADGQPNNLGGVENCVVFRGDLGGLWSDGNCGYGKRGLCEADLQEYLVPACPEGQYQFGGSCYLVSDSDLTSADAETFCADQGGALAFITSQEEQDFLAGVLTNSVTIGSTDAAYPFFTSGSVSGDCFQMSAEDSFNWTDLDCSAAQQALCKIPNGYLASA